LPWKRSDIPVAVAVASAVDVVAVDVVAVLVVAALVRFADAAPPAGEVGLVGASVHAAVVAHTKPSQAHSCLTGIGQTSGATGGAPDPPVGRAVL
jgi:hypothetical protein